MPSYQKSAYSLLDKYLIIIKNPGKEKFKQVRENCGCSSVPS